MITAITIIDTMKKWVEEKRPISPSTYLDAGLKLNILRGDLDDHYFELESELAKQKANSIKHRKDTKKRLGANR
jgi:hypothetical protein